MTQEMLKFKNFGNDGCVELKCNRPLVVRNLNQPAGSIRFFTQPITAANQDAFVAEITVDGVFRVHCEPNDENARKFVELVNAVICSGRSSPLSRMEVIEDGQQNGQAK